MSITIRAIVKRHTERAVLVDYNDEEMWIPKSQVRSILAERGECDLILTDWIANEKGITVGDDERYAVEMHAATLGGPKWLVKDMGVNPIHEMCRCDNERDAMIISGALEMTKNKML